ncbi:CPBP family intramembrane metalloprotease [Akkermansiaceae bacterium]|nr:CPBP family intramembrane metalloprotease [Akkermansiaceae bacterium]
MTLSERIRAGIPIPWVIALGLGWAWVTWSDFNRQAIQPGETDTEVVLRYYDRGLRVTEAAKRGNAYERWMGGADLEEQWLEESRETIRNLYLADLGEPGQDALDAVALRLGEPLTPAEGSDDPVYRREMRDYLLAGHGQAWDYELFLHTENDPEILARYHRENDRLLSRAMWTGNLENAILVAGLCLAGYLMLHRHPPLRGPRIPDSWAATTVMGVFFLGEILTRPWLWLLDLGYGAYYALGGLADIYTPYDALWRAFPAVFSAIFFLRYPHRTWRVFGLGRRIHWPLLIAALAIISAAHWIFFLIAPGTDADPTDFMETASDDLEFFAKLLFSSVIVAPIFEEIIFRGFLFQGLKSKTGVAGAALASTVLFAVVHTQYDIWGWISVGMMGFAACYLTHRTGSLKTAIVFHAIGNLLISLDVYLFYQLPL